MTDISTLRHNAFSAKLAVHRVAAFYHDLKRTDLLQRIPETQDTFSGHQLRGMFDELRDLSRRMESALSEEVTRLSLDAELAVNAYALAHYGFSPGDDIDVGLSDIGGQVKFRVLKVFLQSGTESDIRLDAARVDSNGSLGVRWDLFMKGPGQMQMEKSKQSEANAG
jgi:hypothetical protein